LKPIINIGIHEIKQMQNMHAWWRPEVA